MSAAPGAEQFPDELELLDSSELCLRELAFDTSLHELRTVADSCMLQQFSDDLSPDDLEKSRVNIATTSQKLIWSLYDTGIFISRREDLDTTKRMTCELAMRIHDAFGVDDVRQDRHIETPLDTARQRMHAARATQRQHTVTDMVESPLHEYTKPTFVRLMTTDAAKQLQQDLFTTLGLHIDTLHPDIANRTDHDDFMQTMISLRKLGRASLAAPLHYSADTLRALSRLAEQLAAKVAA